MTTPFSPDMSRKVRRRNFLAASTSALSATVTGCTSFGTTTTTTASKFPTLTLNEVEVSTAEAEYNATLLEQFSESGPAKLKIGFRNKTDTTKEFEFGPAPPFSGLLGRPADNPRDGLVLIPEHSNGHADFYRTEEPQKVFENPTDAIPNEPFGGCWESLGTIDHEPVLTKRTIKPGDTLSNTYHILESAKGTDCYHASRYYFESNSHFDSKKRWGFELLLD